MSNQKAKTISQEERDRVIAIVNKFDEMFIKDSNNIWLLTRRAEALDKLGNFRLGDLKSSQEEDTLANLVLISQVKVILKDFREALSDTNRALKMDPSCASALYVRGDIKANQGDFAASLADFEAALSLKPTDAVLLTNVGLVKSRLKDYAGAIEHLTKAAELNPKNVKVWIGRAQAKKEMNDLTGAQEDYNKCLELEPENVPALVSRGDLKMTMQDQSGALVDYTLADRLQPNDMQIVMRKMMIRVKKNDIEGANEDMKAYAEVAKKDPAKSAELKSKTEMLLNVYLDTKKQAQGESTNANPQDAITDLTQRRLPDLLPRMDLTGTAPKQVSEPSNSDVSPVGTESTDLPSSSSSSSSLTTKTDEQKGSQETSKTASNNNQPKKNNKKKK